jgi:predicted dehydrogenase
MPQPLRIAVLGAGSHSRINHGSSLKAIGARRPGSLELAAVCDLDVPKAREYAEEFGFAKVYGNAHDMIRAERLDALVVVTRPEVTRPVVGELIPYRVPLLIEKPPGEHSAHTRELADLATHHRTPVMVSFNRRFSPALSRALGWLRAAPAGSPRLIHTVSARMIRVARLESGFIVGTGIHLVDTVLSLLGPLRSVVARRWTTLGGGQSCLAVVADARGAAASMLIAPDGGSQEETYELAGEGFGATVDAARCSLTIVERGTRVAEWSADPKAPEYESGGSLAETEAFIESVRSGAPQSPSLGDALCSMLACEALERGEVTDAWGLPR